MNTKSLTVGQEVAILDYNTWFFGYRVTKVTPSGQVIVKRDGSDAYERRFDKRGYEMGGSKFRPASLSADVDTIRNSEDKLKRANKAATAIMAVKVDRCLGTYSVEGMNEQLVQLQKLLDEAKAAVAAI